MEELLGARVLSAATQPLRDFAAELRREFLMAGFEAIGSGCEYFPCTGAWYSAHVPIELIVLLQRLVAW